MILYLSDTLLLVIYYRCKYVYLFKVLNQLNVHICKCITYEPLVQGFVYLLGRCIT
jgi:hypothetical protein